MAEYSEAQEKVVQDKLAGKPNVTSGKMFGMPAFKVNDKLTISVHTLGVVAKVGKKRVPDLVKEDGMDYFEPLEGRVWKDWVLITDIDKHKDVLDEAVKYMEKETS